MSTYKTTITFEHEADSLDDALTARHALVRELLRQDFEVTEGHTTELGSGPFGDLIHTGNSNSFTAIGRVAA